MVQERPVKPSVIDKHDAVLLAKMLPYREEDYHFIDIAVPVFSGEGETLGVLALHLDWLWYAGRFEQILASNGQSNEAIMSYAVVGSDNQLRLLESSQTQRQKILDAFDSEDYLNLLASNHFVLEVSGDKNGGLADLGWRLLLIEPKTAHAAGLYSFGAMACIAFLAGLILSSVVYLRLAKGWSTTAARFMNALANNDQDLLNQVKPQLPAETLPLAEIAQEQISKLRSLGQDLEAALERTHSSYVRLQNVIACTPCAIAMLDLDLKAIGCSVIWRELFDVPDQHAPGLDEKLVLSQMPERMQNACELGLQGMTNIQKNEKWERPGKETRWFNWTVQPWLDQDQNVGGIIIFAEDVTLAQQTKKAMADSEERLILALIGANDGVWDWDIQKDEVFLSNQWKSMLGYQAWEIKDSFSAWEDRLHPDDKDEALETLFNAISDPLQSSISYSFRLAHKQGYWINIQSRAMIVRNDNNVAIRLIGIHLDKDLLNKAGKHSDAKPIALRA